MVSGPPPPGSDRFEIVVHERDLQERDARLFAQHPAPLARALGDHRRRSSTGRSACSSCARCSGFRPTSPRSPRRRRTLSTVIVPSGRRDEIGAAEAHLADMQKAAARHARAAPASRRSRPRRLQDQSRPPQHPRLGAALLRPHRRRRRSGGEALRAKNDRRASTAPSNTPARCSPTARRRRRRRAAS